MMMFVVLMCTTSVDWYNITAPAWWLIFCNHSCFIVVLLKEQGVDLLLTFSICIVFSSNL